MEKDQPAENNTGSRKYTFIVDNEDFQEAHAIKASNIKWTTHKELKEKLEKA